jgi:hypothetical protein
MLLENTNGQQGGEWWVAAERQGTPNDEDEYRMMRRRQASGRRRKDKRGPSKNHSIVLIPRIDASMSTYFSPPFEWSIPENIKT